jgi:hypothetical protein
MQSLLQCAPGGARYIDADQWRASARTALADAPLGCANIEPVGEVFTPSKNP